MTHRTSRLIFASPFLLALATLAGAQLPACSGNVTPSPATDAGPDASLDAGTAQETSIPPPPGDASATSCTLNPTTNPGAAVDFIDFCFQKQILLAEHKVFDPKAGIASSWSSSTGLPDSDGGAVGRDVRDDVAYAASLATYAISAEVYGDTEIANGVVTPDLTALASIVQTKLAILPATYEGELYMRLRRFAAGLRSINDTIDGDKIDAIADAYGRAIYATYFHPLALVTPPDAGPDGGDDAGDDASAGDAGAVRDASSDAQPPPSPLGDGILGVPAAGGGIAYDVDQAATGALALVDLASRNETGDAGADAVKWARAAASVMNHLYLRARHPSGLFYADLVTSSDPDHDALAAVVTPADALLSETQASVAASLARMNGIVQATSLTPLLGFPFDTQLVSPLSGMVGVAPDGGAGLSLWDPTSTPATAAGCATLPDAAACGGSGFFVRYLPSTTGLDSSSKPLRANALAFAAIHRSVALPGTAASIDLAPLKSLFESQAGPSFVSQVSNQASYFAAVKGDLSILTPSFSAQADAYAIEALTEQWLGRQDCPPTFY